MNSIYSILVLFGLCVAIGASAQWLFSISMFAAALGLFVVLAVNWAVTVREENRREANMCKLYRPGKNSYRNTKSH